MSGKVENGSGRTSGGWPHSENQRAEKYRRDMGRKPFGPIDSGVKAKRRSGRIDKSREEFKETERLADEQRRMYEALRVQLLQRQLLHHMLHGELTKQDLKYVAQEEKTIEGFTTPRGSQVTITIVDFGRTKFEKAA